jgi:hypothetical protein
MKQSKELSLQIRCSLIEYYSRHSFDVEQEFTGFSKSTETFKQSIFLGATAEYSSSVLYRPRIDVFNFEVQKIKNKIFGAESRFKNYTIIASQGEKLAQDYGVIGYEGWTMYDIKGEGDIQPMIEHHKEFMEKVGWQFLEQTETIKGIHNYLNTPFINIDTNNLNQEEKTRLVRHNGADWMVNGLVVAWLMKDNDYEKLIENYRAIFFPEHIQQIMNTLIENLK